MPTYERSPSTDYWVIDRWEGGVGWFAHPDEDGARASHAVVGDNGVWLIDPLDAPGIDELISEYGDVCGVAVLSSYHARDANVFATRHEVPVHVPRGMDRVAERVDAPIEWLEDTIPETGFSLFRFTPLSLWQEVIAYREADGTLIVPDLLGSGAGYTVGTERIGVVLSHRLFPPRDSLGNLDPERVLFGHGEGVFEDASVALEDALHGARRRFPRALIGQLGMNIRLFLAAMGDGS